ncbi:hypothetical protein LAZ67_3005775 [Cordylochernes scorpioides]|uniref:PiggyBac transposable element-derived protein domain-containing protein n=1 Tax=Cordylochernes scorpioides TaxID=51811 RepID=A0ABY6KBF1_9ARAC|nr:hypothetical protein LAZ67_3005775 [Cordylochernes scorpioides]
MASDGDFSLSLSNVSDSSTDIYSLESESDSSDSEDIPNANLWLPVYENQPERLLYRFTPATLSGTFPAPDAHPSEYFYLFMTPSLLQSIVDQTNIYASQYISANRSTAKPRSRNWSQETPAFFRIPRDIFWLILKFLHLNHNQNDTKVDPLFKVSPVLESLNKSFLKNLSIDESLVKQKNRTQKRQYIPKSHAKFGIKHWVLCEAQSGYTLQFDIYAGKADFTPSSPKGLAFDVVFRLVNNANLLDKGYHIICDNFYTSVDLALDLYARRTYLTGTMRLNRRSLPSSIRSKKLQPSEKLYRFRDPVLLLRWREKRSQKKPVILLSTKMHASSDEGVDLSDQMLNTYIDERRSLKWWKKLKRRKRTRYHCIVCKKGVCPGECWEQHLVYSFDSIFTSRWSPTIGPPPSRIDWASLRRCAYSGHEADAALKLTLHALTHPAHPASVGPSCPACGSIDRSLSHRYWCCPSIRPLIREAFNIIGRPPDLQAWIFGGSGLEDDALSILASAKLRIYRYFVQVGLGGAVEDPLIAWSRTLQRQDFLPSSPIIIL